MKRFGTKSKGLSIFELLVTLFLLSISLTIILPSFSETIKEQRLRQVSTEFRSAVVLARSEAVKRNRFLGLVPKGTWSQGWCVNIDDTSTTCNDDSVADFGLSSNMTVTTDSETVIFDDWGRTYDCPQFTLTIDNCSVCLAVTTDGRVLSDQGSCTQTCLSSNRSRAWHNTCQ
jgi:type IV fimbrial biogenesis protein FimT